jgi:hypothetical protein
MSICAGDLHTMVNVKLDKFLTGQYHNYEQKFEEAKARLPQMLRGVSIFRDLTAFVTPFALKLVNAQFQCLKCEPTVIVSCTGTFTKTMGLPCAHKIQERWYDRAGGNILKLEDIHPHWRFTKPAQTRSATAGQEDHAMGGDDDADVPGTPPPPPEDAPPEDDGSHEDETLPDDILRVQEPAVVKRKGRPRGSLNKAWAAPSQSQRRRQQALDRSTQRDPSAFEYAPDLPSSQVPDSQPSTQRGGRGGRQRGGRGSQRDVRGGGQRGGRGGAGASTIEGQIADVPASYMGSFQM